MDLEPFSLRAYLELMQRLGVKYITIYVTRPLQP